MSSQAQVDQKSKPVHSMHFKCELCKKKYATEASVIKHIEKCHEVEIKSATCPMCKKRILVKKNLNRHIRNVHSNPKQKKSAISVPTCDQCEQHFSSKHKLVEHMKRKHSAASKEGVLLQCSECDFSNISESRMKAHFTLVHSEPKEFKCKFCSLSLKSKCGIYKHIKKVHTLDQQLEKPQEIIARKSLPAVVHDNSMMKSLRQNSFVGQKQNVTQNFSQQNSRQAPTVVQNLISTEDNITLELNLQPRFGEMSIAPQNCLLSDLIGQNSVQQADVIGQNCVQKFDVAGQNCVQQPDVVGQNSLQHPVVVGQNSLQQPGFIGLSSLQPISNPSTSQLLPDNDDSNLLDISLDNFMDISLENIPEHIFGLIL